MLIKLGLSLAYFQDISLNVILSCTLCNLFYGYADAAYANTDDLQTTTGYVFLVGGGAIM